MSPRRLGPVNATRQLLAGLKGTLDGRALSLASIQLSNSLGKLGCRAPVTACSKTSEPASSRTTSTSAQVHASNIKKGAALHSFLNAPAKRLVDLAFPNAASDSSVMLPYS